MFCCGCLNTEAKLRILDENVTRAIKELLGLKVSREPLNTLHILNFKPNLTQSQVLLINIGSALKTNVDSFCHIKQEIKSEVPDESTFTGAKETSPDVKIKFTDEDVLSNEYVVKICEEFIRDDETAPETVLFVTDNELNEEIVVKEEYSDFNQEENVDIADVESELHADDDTPLKKILARDVPNILHRIDVGASTGKRTFYEIQEKTKLIRLDETTVDRNTIPNADLKRLPKNNYKASDVSFSKMLSVESNLDISKSKQIIKTTANCYEVNKISPKVNILPEDKVQAFGVIVQDHKTPISNAENETFKQCFPKRMDVVAPSTSLDRSDEGNNINISSKKLSENELLCHICQFKCATIIHLDKHLRKHTGEKPYACDMCDYILLFMQDGFHNGNFGKL